MIKRLQVQILAGLVGEFSSPESTFCAGSYAMSVPPCVTTVACERPRLFSQKCRWQVTPKHAHTFDLTKSEWADKPLSRHSLGTYHLSGNKLTCNSSGNALSQSSQLAEPLWADPGLKSGISVRQLISNLLKKKLKKWAGGK